MDTAPGGGVMAYTQHGLYRIILDDSLTKGRAEQINFSVYGKPEPMTLDRINALTGLGMTTPLHIPYFIYAILVVLVFAAGITVLRRRKRRAESAMTDSDVTVGEGNCKPLPHPGQVPGYDFAERAAVLLDRHIADEDFNIEDFAREMAVSRAQLFRKLKAANGKTPNEFIMERRMLHAAKLLKDTDLHLDTVALKVGINDTSNFRCAFVKVWGITPSEYRSQEAASDSSASD